MTSRHVTPLLAYWTASGELVFIAILIGAVVFSIYVHS